MSKTRFRAMMYFAAAFLPPWAAGLEKAVSVKDYLVATLAAIGTACIALRAYADQTPGQDDALHPEPSLQKPTKPPVA